jgi:hypothetical protein
VKGHNVMWGTFLFEFLHILELFKFSVFLYTCEKLGITEQILKKFDIGCINIFFDISVLVKSGQKLQTLHVDLYVLLCASPA